MITIDNFWIKKMMSRVKMVRLLVFVQVIGGILISFFFIILLFASGHKINPQDSAQMILLFEILILMTTAIALATKIESVVSNVNLVVLILLFLALLSVGDLVIEIGKEGPFIGILVPLVFFAGSNATLLWHQLKMLMARLNAKDN